MNNKDLVFRMDLRLFRRFRLPEACVLTIIKHLERKLEGVAVSEKIEEVFGIRHLHLNGDRYYLLASPAINIDNFTRDYTAGHEQMMDDYVLEMILSLYEFIGGKATLYVSLRNLERAGMLKSINITDTSGKKGNKKSMFKMYALNRKFEDVVNA